ncbi:hypothetical protein GLAREA_12589 [Glarea lozoyensis ATCC 20868]|uniref:Uncharacterized protein n=1 Tax=Glarea lozoyensis (strain ATCC 20868 / MF5171) TaxID=1116229 RepID=S3DH00_GLAL2|nr:uncharacterized protein GLAREA_12589 [Glarea lozoyensis ATCC 20868]EPE31286.1 hypothetical protein GLAREA_12589 [Glarea lozoyensis ATCC 20868]
MSSAFWYIDPMATSCGDSTPIIRTPQENDPSELDFKCRGLNKSDTGSSLPKPLPQKDENEVIGDVENFGIQFELHYDLSGRNTTEILQDILWEMSWRTPVHNWDIKIVPDSMSVLAMKGRQYLKANPLSHSLGLSTLTSYSTVEEILYHGGICERLPASEGSNDIARHMFFRKDAFKDNQSLFSFSKAVSNGDRALHGVCLQGRIIFIKEHVPHPQKDCLLLLYSLTIRLQYEEYGFIRAFIDRHLSLRTSVKMPYHWQETLPPELTSQTSGSKGSGSGKIPLLNISEESSSTLLTIVIPEESVTKEEENGLLTDPNGLWTVLVVNGPPDFGSGLEPSHHLTPISQFLRGIVASLCTLRSNAQAIYRELKDLLALHDNNTIFDDENFTKSTLYHCTVKNCGEVVTCITSTLRFIRRTKKSHLDKLCRDAHAREKPGIDHWAREIEEEIFNLEDLKEEILALSAGVQESRNALHGATSVLEARLAAQQTHRMNTLAYLATLYIPLTASTHVRST